MSRFFILACALALLTALTSGRDAPALAIGLDTSISHVEPGLENVLFPSLELDGSGNPVLSYAFSHGPTRLRVVHCNDPACFGGDESITEPDPTSDAGYASSLELDPSGNPVVSYVNAAANGLKVVHCNDPDCAENDESISTLDPAIYPQSTSLELDSSGNPVVAYYNSSNTELKLLHCNDANCTGGGESLTAPDTAGDVGLQVSLALDASGNPVMSYLDRTSSPDLKVLHCNEANCAGGDDPSVTVDSDSSVGYNSSLALDASGFPVISFVGFYISSAPLLRVAHCNDANCAGGNESLQSLDGGLPFGGPGSTALALDALGNPAVSYVTSTTSTSDLTLARCNDPNCAGGDESIVGVDEARFETAMTLDPSGNPVIAYHSLAGGAKVLHCGSATCASLTDATPVGANVIASLGPDVDVTFSNVAMAGVTALSTAKGSLPGLNVAGPYYNISTTAGYSSTITVCIHYDGSSYTPLEEGSLRMGHYEKTAVWADSTTSLNTSTDRICGLTTQLSPFTYLPLVPGQDQDGDTCPNEAELGINQITGGKRNAFNPWDYFNPSGDGKNRVDDILLVVNQYFKDDSDPSAGRPPYQPGYTPGTDRRLVGPDAWDLSAPDGQERVDDILNQVNQYFHDCA